VDIPAILAECLLFRRWAITNKVGILDTLDSEGFTVVSRYRRLVPKSFAGVSCRPSLLVDWRVLDVWDSSSVSDVDQ